MSGVCVIIVNWNSGKLLGRCLSALRTQTLPPSRIIVVDNASTDPDLPETGDGFELIRRATNTGFAAANNLGVQMAGECAWIALLNPDAFPESGWLEALLDAAAAFPEYSCFSSRMVQAGQTDVLDGAGDAYHVSGRVWRRGHGASAAGRYASTEEVFSACAAAALYRRDALETVGGFDEDFFCYLEDVDLGFRLRLAGHRCLYVPDAVVHHVGSATTGRHSDFAVYHGQRNLVWTYVKNMPGILLWLYLPQHLLINAGAVLEYALKGRLRVIARSKLDAIKELPRMWKKRKVVRAQRVVSAWALREVMEKGLPLQR